MSIVYINTMTMNWLPELPPTEEPLYLAITRALSEDISVGRLKPGFRLPTHRELADRLGVALGTVTRAYAEAEKRGLIHGEGRRGTLVGESPKGKFSLSSLLDTDSRIVDLSKNYPSYDQDPDLTVALRKLSRRPETQHLLRYPNPSGMPHHRAAGATWISAMGLKVGPEEVMVTAGAQHALTAIFSGIAESGDTVVSEAYTYPGLKAVADMFSLRLVGVATDREGMDPEMLESVCRQRKVRALYCNPTLHNPTSIIYSEERRRRIVEIAEKYDIIIIEDDILRPLVEDPPPLISALAPERSCLIASTSKVIAAGLRVGFVVAPVRVKSVVSDSLRAITLVAPTLPTEIVSTWISDGTAQKVIVRRRAETRARQQLVQDVLGRFDICSHPLSPVVWIRLPDRWTTTEYVMEAHNRGVAIVPAETFAVNKTASENAVRICLGTAASHRALTTGLEILSDMLLSVPGRDASTI